MFPEGIHFVPIFCFFYVFVDIAVVIHNEEFEHANPHKLNICITSKAESLTSQTLNEQIFPHKVETLHYGSRLQYPQKHKRSKRLEQNEWYLLLLR
jgi:predicted restriction endonuclease